MCEHENSIYLNKSTNSEYVLLRVEVCCVQEKSVNVQEDSKHSVLFLCSLTFRRSINHKPMHIILPICDAMFERVSTDIYFKTYLIFCSPKKCIESEYVIMVLWTAITNLIQDSSLEFFNYP